jgi:hypothetical protein
MYTSDYAASSKKPYTSDYASSSKAKSSKPKNVNKNVKVSQSEIDTIKKMGMTKALASAGTASASVQEGIRRLYGERRYQAATYKPNGVTMGATTSGSFRAGERASSKPASFRSGERSASAPTKVGKPKDTSFNKSGVSGVLKSPEAKKFRSTFAKKGLIPALRGK